jgi:hypothetical protein
MVVSVVGLRLLSGLERRIAVCAVQSATVPVCFPLR